MKYIAQERNNETQYPKEKGSLNSEIGFQVQNRNNRDLLNCFLLEL